jgi:oxygen-dependent protoporphyrinogen oxidase
MKRYDVIVIGGGISGLSSLYYLAKTNSGLDLALFESENLLGGKIRTYKEGGRIFEAGPDSLFSYKKFSVDFLTEIGFGNDIVGSCEDLGIYLYTNGRLYRYPSGIFSLYPANVIDFFRSDIFSWYGKLRFLWEVFVPPLMVDKDESLYEFGVRRFGKEITDRLIAPLLGGIYAGDPKRMSLKALFPHYYMMERKYKSIIKAMLYNLKNRSKNKLSPFISVKGGLYSIIERMKNIVKGADIYLGEEVKEVRREGYGFRIVSSNYEVWGKAIIISTELFRAYEFLRRLDDDFSILKSVPYTNTAVVVMRFDEEPLDSKMSGFLVDVENERDISITGATFISYKWEKLTDWDGFWVRCFVGSARNDSIVELPKDRLIEMAVYDFTRIMDIKATPSIVKLFKWIKAMPQYEIGHIEKVKEIERILLRNRGIFIASSGYKGVGIPDCIKQGNEVASLVLRYLG